MLFSAAVFLGMTAHALDLEFSRKLDILSSFGFLTTLYTVPCTYPKWRLLWPQRLFNHQLALAGSQIAGWRYRMVRDTLHILLLHAAWKNKYSSHLV